MRLRKFFHNENFPIYGSLSKLTYWYSIPGAVDEQKHPWWLVVW